MYALPTENVTFVLDCCDFDGAKRGNFRVRSRDGGELLQPSQAEFDTQQRSLESSLRTACNFLSMYT